MSNYLSHAMTEFRAAGWTDENGKFNDEMQEAICDHVCNLLQVFNDEGHSGSSAPYAVDLFQKLALFKPITPLTGEDWEWTEIDTADGGPVYQNKRAGNVFKDSNGAYDINGKVFYDEDDNGDRSYYTCRESRVPVTFPYKPVTEYLPTSIRTEDKE